jgi:hypothetical protein
MLNVFMNASGEFNFLPRGDNGKLILKARNPNLQAPGSNLQTLRGIGFGVWSLGLLQGWRRAAGA